MHDPRTQESLERLADARCGAAEVERLEAEILAPHTTAEILAVLQQEGEAA